MRPEPVGEDRVAEVTSVLADAFRDYPVMRFVLGPERHAADLERLVELFVRGRFARGGRALGIGDGAGGLAAVATITVPGEPPAPSAYVAWRESRWAELGGEARRRYDAFAASATPFEPAGIHHHLNMIGVRGAHRGRGLSRPLLEAVHRMAAEDPASTGVSLTTELRSNLTLYEHFGYRILGQVRVAETLDSWVMFRPSRVEP